MTAVVLVLGALGLALLLAGLPVVERTRLGRRLEPYLSGLDGRPSRLLRSDGHNAVGQWLDRQTRRLTGKDSDLAERLPRAGFSGGIDDFRLEQLVWGAIAGVATAAWLTLASGPSAASGIAAAISFVAAFLARDWWLTKEAERRTERLRQELPSAIDLVTLSLMAGESVPVAFERVASLMGGGIGDEFGSVVSDVRAGETIIEALEELARRVPEPGFARFVDALATGIEKGTPLAETLRAQADDGREARRRHLLELGGRREVLMLVPVVFLIMPVVVAFALMPGLASLDLLVP